MKIKYFNDTSDNIIRRSSKFNIGVMLNMNLRGFTILKFIFGFLLVISMTSCCFMFFKGYNCIDNENKLKNWGKYQDIESKLRIDGEYYNIEWDSYFKTDVVTRLTIYTNGIYHGFVGFAQDNGKDSTQYKRYLEFFKSDITGWGSYSIIGDSIFFHELGAIDGEYYVGDRKGRIGKNKICLMVDEDFYQFDSTANKPDSVTDLFKNDHLKIQLIKGYENFLKRGKK